MKLQGLHAYARPIRSWDTSHVDPTTLAGLGDTPNEDSGPGIVRIREILHLVKLRAQVRRCALL